MVIGGVAGGLKCVTIARSQFQRDSHQKVVTGTTLSEERTHSDTDHIRSYGAGKRVIGHVILIRDTTRNGWAVKILLDMQSKKN